MGLLVTEWGPEWGRGMGEKTCALKKFVKKRRSRQVDVVQKPEAEFGRGSFAFGGCFWLGVGGVWGVLWGRLGLSFFWVGWGGVFGGGWFGCLWFILSLWKAAWRELMKTW